MNAADSTSMLKTTKIRPSCAMIVGGGSQLLISVRSHRHPRRAPVGRYRAASLADVRFEFGAEVFHRRQRRGCRGVAEGAQRLAGNVVADADEQVDVPHLSFTALDAGEDLVEPVAPFTARSTLAARLVLVEIRKISRRPDHAGRLVHDDDACGPQHRPGLLHMVEAGRYVELVG